MQNRMRWCATLLFAGALAAAPQTRTVIAGTVAAPDGPPVEGAEVALFWLGGSPVPAGFAAYGAAKTNGQGVFELPASQPHFPVTLFAMDSGRRRGAVAVISSAEAAGHVEIRLQPLRRVQYRFQSPRLTDLSRSRITLQPASGPMFSQVIGPPRGAVALPPGSYTIGISMPGSGEKKVSFDVADGDVVLDPIDLPPSLAQYYGHPAPPLTGTVQVNGDSFAPESLRGKWTAVYFWGYWCAPCVNVGLPKLRQFYEKNRARRDQFEILAVHENGVEGNITAAELQTKLDGLAKDKWSGAPLPFPVLLDRSGDTIKSWAIAAYPTLALINPLGEVAPGDLDTLQRILDER